MHHGIRRASGKPMNNERLRMPLFVECVHVTSATCTNIAIGADRPVRQRTAAKDPGAFPHRMFRPGT